jgi:hypothetical protein
MSGFQPVAGGGASSAEDAARARAVLAAAATELDSLRGSAAKWQAGLVALAGGITAFGLIKGRDDVAGLRSPWGVACGIVLAVALIASLAAGVLAMRAAFGLPRVISTAQWYPQSDAHRQAVSARGSLLAAIWLTVTSIALLAGAAGIIWYCPPQAAGAALSVTERTGVTVCGPVEAVTGGRILLATAGGVVSVDLVDVAGMKPVRSCGGR